MSVKHIAAVALAMGALAACQDSPVTPGDAESSSQVTVIRPEEYARYGITPLALPERGATEGPRRALASSGYADIDYYSVSAWNGVVNGNDQVQLISVQNGFSGISYHSLSTSFYTQAGCSSSYVFLGGDFYESYNGNPVGLSSQRTLRWPSSSLTRGLVTATHYFAAASGYTVSGAPSATFYSSADECR